MARGGHTATATRNDRAMMSAAIRTGRAPLRPQSLSTFPSNL